MRSVAASPDSVFLPNDDKVTRFINIDCWIRRVGAQSDRKLSAAQTARYREFIGIDSCVSALRLPSDDNLAGIIGGYGWPSLVTLGCVVNQHIHRINRGTVGVETAHVDSCPITVLTVARPDNSKIAFSIDHYRRFCLITVVKNIDLE